MLKGHWDGFKLRAISSDADVFVVVIHCAFDAGYGV